MAKTRENCEKFLTESDVSHNETIAAVNSVSNEVNALQEEKNKTIANVQVCLNDVKDAIKVIDMVLSAAVEIIHGHTKRLTKARHIVLVALDTKLKINDSKIKVIVYENTNITKPEYLPALCHPCRFLKTALTKH